MYDKKNQIKQIVVSEKILHKKFKETQIYELSMC